MSAICFHIYSHWFFFFLCLTKKGGILFNNILFFIKKTTNIPIYGPRTESISMAQFKPNVSNPSPKSKLCSSAFQPWQPQTLIFVNRFYYLQSNLPKVGLYTSQDPSYKNYQANHIPSMNTKSPVHKHH